MIWHDEANKILDMKERKDQVAYFRSLPPEMQKYVGPLVAMQKKASKNHRILGWRAIHEYTNS